MSEQIILTTGIYDLIKDHVRRRKVTPEEGELLTGQLRKATQVRRSALPDDVVSINTKVTIKDVQTGAEEVYSFVPPGKGKPRRQTQSIMTPIGLALVGCSPGARMTWPVAGKPKVIEILKVEQI